MRPISFTIPASGTIDIPVDLYVAPQNIVWAASAALTSVTGLLGPQSTFSGNNLPNGGTYGSTAGAPSGSGIWQQQGQITETTGTVPSAYVTSVAVTSPITNGAYSALRFVGTAGTTVTLNQSGITT